MGQAEDITALKVDYATLSVTQKHILHHLKNIDQKMDALASKEDLASLQGRVSKVESIQTWITRSATAGFATVIGGFYAVGKKLGLG